MKKSLIMTALVILAGAGVTVADSGGEENAVKLTVGAKAPEFSLPGSDGKVHSLTDHLGKRAVVIAWFPKAFTGG